MKTNNYNYETVFDTANRTMTFIIHPRLQIVINFANSEISVVKDGSIAVKESLDDEQLSLDDMELILKQACEAADKLKKFD
jgi:archaellum component FlaG (FlaF/FlaG flagellin family)